MGLSFSCPLSNSHDLENQIQSVVVKSVSFGDNDEVKTHVRSVSFNGRDSEPTILRSLGSGEMVVEGSISFKRRKTDTMISITPCSLHKGTSSSMELVNDEIKQMDSQSPKKVKQSPNADLGNSKNEAAVKLQKVYKSFRTRRKLADCAVVLAEQSIFPGQTWWTLLDSVELEQTSISFFNINKPDTASSRWSRAKMKAAKVGKGLSKNEKARKLALQHWLEAIDPRHRYGHNLQFYFLKWRSCKSKEPFFYWLDIGEGKEVNLVEVCPRKKLQYQCIKYLGPEEREAYEVVVDDGKFLYKQTEQVLETASKPKDAKWIFVLSTSGNLYVGKKIKGEFQHSSFLAGGATSAAGRLVVQNGILKAVWAHSGHYKPTEENFSDFISFLKDNNVDLTAVKMSPEDDEQGSLYKKKSSLVRCFSEENLKKNIACSEEDEMTAACMSPGRINEREEENLDCEQKENDEIANEEDEMKSFQLGKQLSGKWISGVGPRIEIVKEYPSEMKFRALELVNLSPRGSTKPESHFCLSSDRPKLSLASSWGKCNTFQACIQDGMKQPSPLRKSTSIP